MMLHKIILTIPILNGVNNFYRDVDVYMMCCSILIIHVFVTALRLQFYLFAADPYFGEYSDIGAILPLQFPFPISLLRSIYSVCDAFEIANRC